MTTAQEEVQSQLSRDYDNFLSSVYVSKVGIPKNLIEAFKIGIMMIGSFNHKINFNKVKIIASSKIEDLRVGEINEIIRVVMNVPPERIYKDFKSAVEGNIALEKLVVEYNETIENFKKQLDLKKVTLESLAGGVMQKNNSSLRLIKAQA